MSRSFAFAAIAVVSLLSLGLPSALGLQPPPAGPTAWFDDPLAGLSYKPNVVIPIQGHATDNSGVASFVLAIDGQTVDTQPGSNTTFDSVISAVGPLDSGEYQLTLTGVGQDGTRGKPAVLALRVGPAPEPAPSSLPEAQPAATPSVTATASPASTVAPTPAPSATVESSATAIPTVVPTPTVTVVPVATPTVEPTATPTQTPQTFPVPNPDSPLPSCIAIQPENAAPTPGQLVDPDAAIGFLWLYPLDVCSVDSFEIQISANASFESIAASHTAFGGEERFFLLRASLDNGIYFWRVRAIVDSSGAGPWSTTTAFFLVDE